MTKDADLLSFGPVDTGAITEMFQKVCVAVTQDVDGMEFVSDSIRAVQIREGQAYAGVRVNVLGLLHHARIPMQVDIGFGDVVTPGPERVQFPTILDAPAPRLLAYPRYTVVAEKFEAMVRLGIANSRMKDSYDTWLLSRLFTFEGMTLCTAVRNTFQRRSTPLPAGEITVFTDEFRKDSLKQAQWRAFMRKATPEDVPGDIGIVLGEIEDFLIPVLEAIGKNKKSLGYWPQGGPWSSLYS